MRRVELGAFAILIIYSAFYADAVGWVKNVCYTIMLILAFVVIIAGGKEK